ncbi:MAG TPA: halocarboxylic acid dehydrogenase DehI family protein [Patescibacteria group bacterium]
MLHIRPVSEGRANEKVQEVYKDIKATFEVDVVPLLFQYLAGFEEYFFYAWDKIKRNVESKYFKEAAEEIAAFGNETIPEVYEPSLFLEQFVKELPEDEIHKLKEIIQNLQKINSQLLLLTIGMREGLKGVHIGREFLLQENGGEMYEEIFDQFINNKIMRENLANEKDLEGASKMLAPLFGSDSLQVVRYPEFFGKIALEMQELIKSELYLGTRVGLERVGVMMVGHFSYPLGTSYQEIATFAGKKPYFHELLYILSETFPTNFPRLVLTTSVMKSVLNPKKISREIENI